MPKTREQKKQLMEFYKQAIDSGNFVIIKLNKAPANAYNAARLAMRDTGSKFAVIKNKIFKKASEDREDIQQFELTGQLGIIVGGDDIVSALKALDVFEETAKLEYSLAGADEEALKDYRAYEFYFGVVEGQVLTADQVAELKNLPGKDVLLAQLVGTIAAPLTGFMNAAQGTIRNLMYALNDLKAQKQ